MNGSSADGSSVKGKRRESPNSVLDDSKEDGVVTEAVKGKASKLDHLLERAKAYSDFLFQQMNGLNLPEPQEEEAPTAGKGRGKRKAAGGARKGAQKRTRASHTEAAAETETPSDRVDGVGLSEGEICEREQARIAPKLTGGKLKSYQLEGIKWLISLWKNGLNGILADQMGLGKTIQTIGFLAHLLSQGVNGPFLVVAPLSTLSNWINEIKRWMPGVPVLLFHGDKTQRAKLRESLKLYNPQEEFPIIITSFEIAMLDRRWLQHYDWKYLVVDEGHRLKNFECKLIRELRKLKVENALLLTGTPLQNNLKELWSLLNFILPDLFSSAQEFTAWFDLHGENEDEDETDQESASKERREQVLAMLHQILRPFLLRRLKEDVEKNIPPKTEIILYATMTEKQKSFLEHLINKTLEQYLRSNSAMPSLSKTLLRNVFMQLRKNCNHPDLIATEFDNNLDYPPVDELVAECGKLRLLDRLVPKIKERGHKVLIFSQMTRLLDILEYYLQSRGYHPYRIDGSVNQEDRQEQIKEFQTSPEAFVFLLSTRAGGLGINLTAADTVIIYDSDWNPHMDMQAMDRCHRIGQTKPVHIYRLATANSIEGRMLATANRKMNLEHLVIEKGEFNKLDKDSNAKQTVAEIGDVVALLRPEQNEEEEFVQSAEISDENLERLLDRANGVSAQQKDDRSLPLKGPGWEVVMAGGARGNVLSSIS